MRRASLLVPLLLAAAGLPAQTACSKDISPAQLDRRIDALIGSMTLEEKVAQLGDQAPAVPRLHLPAYNWWNEGLHGLARDGYATVFPQAIGLAATWDPALLKGVGDTVSTEARAKFNGHGSATADHPRYGGLTVWSPNINIFRDPRWGRGQETYGEDPFLTATLGSAFVAGVEGADPFYLKADATPKHFAAHSGPEHGRDSFNAVVSPHDLADTYFPAFHALTAGLHGRAAAATMCSYNEINGTPSCASAANLTSMLRGAWGFGGYVVSDCDAVGDISDYHHWAPDAEHAAAAALNAGVDLDCGSTYGKLAQAVRQGLTAEARVDAALHRLLLARAHLGLLDGESCTPWGHLSASELDSPAHHALALRAAEESVVLLQNNPAPGGARRALLPLRPSAKIAVLGVTADSLATLEANYHGTAVHPVTPLAGLRAQWPQARYAQGAALAAGLPAPVPETALRTPDGQPGLRAEYFDHPSMDGAPALTVTVPGVQYDLDRVGPDPSIHAAQYAARWSGQFVPPAPGAYTLHVAVERCWDCAAHDQFSLWVDGKLAMANHGSKGEPEDFTLQASDTRPHALRLELVHTGEDEGITLAWQAPPAALLDEAMAVARDADVVVVFAGLGPDLEGEALQVSLPGFDGGDRTTLDLPESQHTLLERVAALGKPMVVVLTSGSAVVLDADTRAKASAILEAWYPGEAGGEALAHVLSGAVNPSGRLPVTFYRSVADLPAFTDYSMAQRTYRYHSGPVLYPFGYGLSYTSFTYGEPRPSITHAAVGQPVTVTSTVRNTGAVAGDAVVELYVQAPPSLPGAPRLALAGVRRVHLAPGEQQPLSLTLSPDQLQTVDNTGARAERTGTYRVFVGGAQPGLGDPGWRDLDVQNQGR